MGLVGFRILLLFSRALVTSALVSVAPGAPFSPCLTTQLSVLCFKPVDIVCLVLLRRLLLLGWPTWRFVWLYPFAAFAWVWSLLVYVFHYHTTIGEHTRYNVRALPQNRFFSWLLLNFNQHASHHMYPNIPWYQLPERKQELPQVFTEKNQVTDSYWRAILNQLRGPTVVYTQDRDPTPQLFVRWED